MTHAAKILAHSVTPDGVPLVSVELRYPRIIHAEMMTHRMFSRNAASSRAIPVEKMIQSVMDNPYIPSEWGKNQKGMQAEELLGEKFAEMARSRWLRARDHAVVDAEHLLNLGVHKQLTNRLLEPFLWYTAIYTATETSNFFNLRDHVDAHPDIRIIAKKWRDAMEASTPRELKYGEWHLPLIQAGEPVDWDNPQDGQLSDAECIQVSVGRCARVSYLTHDGKRDPQADIDLHDRLLKSGHLSPFEHVARPANNDDWKPQNDALRGPVRYAPDIQIKDVGDGPYAWLPPEKQWHGNLRGWVSYRKMIPHEDDILGVHDAED